MHSARIANERCHAVLLLLQKLHEVGYGGLRFMPTLDKGSWSIDFGPRLLFSCRDGSFVPLKLRHRLVRFSGSDTPLSLDGRPLDVLEEAFYSRGTGASFDHDAKGSFGNFLQQSKLQDDAYCMWLKSLRTRIESEPGAFPNRQAFESSTLEKSVFFLSHWSSQDGGYVNLDFPPPPPGEAASSGPQEDVQQEDELQEEQDESRDEDVRWIQRETCSTCSGIGKVKSKKTGGCPTCKGKGSTIKVKPCPDCNGEGLRVLESSGACTTCKGKGWIKKAKRDEELCPDCNGDGTRIESSRACTTCKGKGQIEKEEQCPECNGKGMIGLLTSCKKCKGKGYSIHIFEYREQETECSSCNGDGNYHETVDCYYCKGLGWVTQKQIPFNTVNCEACGGAGSFDVEYEDPCPDCDGRGYVIEEVPVDITPRLKQQ